MRKIAFISFTLLTLFFVTACGNYKWDNIFDLNNDLPDVAQPILNPPGNTYLLAQTVSMTCATEGAVIFYTLDGSTPTQTSNPYSGPVFVPANMTIKAKAFKNGCNASPITSGSYVITTPTVSNPLISPAGDTYSTAQNITITCTTPGAEIRYTIDGTDPNPASSLYHDPLPLSVSTTIKARAYKTDCTPSQIVAQVYEFVVATPIIEPNEGYYTTDQTVTITCPTAGAEIKYTLDGSEPTNASAIYTQALHIYTNTTVKAKAYKSGCTSSSTTTASYSFNLTVADPVLQPGTGNYVTPGSVAISCNTSGAKITYTIDGSEPNINSTEYISPVYIDGNITIRAKAFKTNWTPSGTVTGTYAFQVNSPEFNPPAGTYTSEQSVSISCSTVGAVIHYTTDGTTPNANSPTYSSAIDVSGTTTLKAIAIKANWSNSSVISSTYTMNLTVPTPVLDPPGGGYPSGQQVNITCSLAGSTIRYTLNGSEPNSGSTLYTTTLTIDTNRTLKALAFKPGWTPSAIVTGDYIIGLFYDFEGWNGNFISQAGWQYGTPNQVSPHSGTELWAMSLSGPYPQYSIFSLFSPRVHISENSLLKFYHKYDFENGSGSVDGGCVKISVDGGSTWDALQPVGGYPNSNVQALGQPGFSHTLNTWELVTIDLSLYINQDVIINWHAVAGQDVHSNPSPGWFIDDVLITNATEVVKKKGKH